MYSFFRVLTWIIFIGACFLVFGNPDVFGKYPAHVKLIGLLLIFVPLLIVKSIVTNFSGTNTEPPTKIEANVVKPLTISPKTESLISSSSSNEIKSKTEPIPPENSPKNMTSEPSKYKYGNTPLPQYLTDLINKFESGLANATEIWHLSSYYYSGYGGTNFAPSKLKSTELLKIAAEHGSVEAQFNLAIRFRDGDGVPRDYEESVKRLRLAAEEGNGDAQGVLGILYLPEHKHKFTDLLLSDLIEAYAWINLAGMQSDYEPGVFFLRNLLRDIESKLTSEQILTAQKRSREILAQIETRIAEKKKTEKK